jgi:hypothetical protein
MLKGIDCDGKLKVIWDLSKNKFNHFKMSDHLWGLSYDCTLDKSGYIANQFLSIA